MIKRAILTELTGAVDDDGLAMRGDQVLIFQHFQNTTNGFAGAADDLADFLTSDFDLHPIRVRHGIGLFRQIQQRLSDTPGDVKEGEVTYFSEVTCKRRAIWEERRIRISGLTWINWRNFL